MSAGDGRDLDLNLLRVFLVVAETGSVTAAAARLYLTQPAISAALKRLTSAVGAPLFARRGRGLVLTARGKRLETTSRPHLRALVDAALAPATFDPRTSDATVRIGVSDTNEAWLLPHLLRVLADHAPRMRLLVVPVQFRDVGEALASGRIDLAVCIADDVPAGTHREALLHGGFTCLFDPRHARLTKTPTLASYLAQDHVLVSYNGDFRGVVEDMFRHQRRVRCSVASFHAVGDAIDGTALVATIPMLIASVLRRHRPHLRTAVPPFAMRGTPMELLIASGARHDEAVAFVCGHVREAARLAAPLARGAVVRKRRPEA